MLAENQRVGGNRRFGRDDIVEGYLLLVAMIATVLAVYWSIGADSRGAGKPVDGLFAYSPGREPKPPERRRLEIPASIRRPRPDTGTGE